MMDTTFTHPTDIHVIRPCHNDDALDLIAIGGDHSVDILSVGHASCSRIASFHIGSRITAIAWSSSSVSPSSSDEWSLELVVASDDFGLHLLTKSHTEPQYIFPFGGGLSGHHGKINDMVFCGGWSDDSSRYVATVSDDKMLMVWDLHPNVDIPSARSSLDDLNIHEDALSPPPRSQPTAYVVPFRRPLSTISSHPLTSKEFLVSDCHGSLFLTDWRSDEGDNSSSILRHSTLLELVEPYALSSSCIGYPPPSSGSAAWRSDVIDIIGGVYGSRFSIWDLSQLRGSKPIVTAHGNLEGAHRFRWCRTYPEHFAISTQSPSKGAVINIYNLNFVQSQPSVFSIRPRPQFVRDFDFLSTPGIPRVAAAVGNSVLIFSIGEDS